MRKDTEGYDLEDVLDLVKSDIMLRLNCHAIAKIVSFDSSKITCTAKVMYSKTFEYNNQDGTTSTRYVDYPLLVDVPVVVAGGGKISLTFPIQAGDECIIMFNDRDLSSWFKGAKSGPLPSNRMHSLSDGIALVGLIKPKAWDASRGGLQSDKSSVLVGDKVKVANQSDTLGALLQQLTTQLNTLTTTLSTLTVTGVQSGTGTSGPPAQAAAITNVGTQISSIATKIGGLLE